MVKICCPAASQGNSEAPGIMAVAAFLASGQMPYRCGLAALAIVAGAAAGGRLLKFILGVTGFATQNGVHARHGQSGGLVIILFLVRIIAGVDSRNHRTAHHE